MSDLRTARDIVDHLLKAPERGAKHDEPVLAMCAVALALKELEEALSDILPRLQP